MGRIFGWRVWVWFLLAPLSVGVASAHSHAAEESRRDALLYAIQSPDAPAPSYLFGTIHSEDPRVLDLPLPVRTAFRDSPSFALEVIPDTNAIIRSMVTMTYTDGRTLREVLPEDLYEETAEALRGRGMPTAAFRDFKPWAVITLLSVPRAQTGEFLDMMLYREAVAADKRIEGLESIDEQLAVFDDLAECDQIALLRETLDALEDFPAMFEGLIDAYLARDLDALAERSEDYLDAGDPELADLFRRVAVVSRNHRMAARMIPLLKEGGWFIAVGALHLPTANGILSLIQEQGFLVTPVH